MNDQLIAVPEKQSETQNNGLAPGLKPEDLALAIQAPAYQMWRASVVSRWLLEQLPNELTRACLRGMLPRLDPRVADMIVGAVLEQLATWALVQVQASELQLKHEEAIRQQEAVEKALASGLSAGEEAAD